MVFIEPYIAALRADPEEAVAVFELWDAGTFSDEIAMSAWLRLSEAPQHQISEIVRCSCDASRLVGN